MSFHDEEMEIVTLEFEDGTTIECTVLGVFPCEGREYIALMPQDSTNDIFLYGYRETGEEDFEVLDIEDDAEFQRVQAAFEEIAGEMLDDVEFED